MAMFLETDDRSRLIEDGASTAENPERTGADPQVQPRSWPPRARRHHKALAALTCGGLLVLAAFLQHEMGGRLHTGEGPAEAVEDVIDAEIVRRVLYWKIKDTFCHNFHKVRPVIKNVGADKCRQLCSTSSECKAFEMFKNGDDCTLLSECTQRGHSSIGSYVLIKLDENKKPLTGGFGSAQPESASPTHMSPQPKTRPEDPNILLGGPPLPPRPPSLGEQPVLNNAVFTPARPAPVQQSWTEWTSWTGGAPAADIMPSGPSAGIMPSPPHWEVLPEEPEYPRRHHYDCEVGTERWETLWSDGKKDYCCNHYYNGCPEPGRPHHHLDDDRGEYDCREHVSTWDVSWSPGKKHYCCTVYYNGCPSTGTAFDCHARDPDWRRTWSPRKKSWCCKTHSIACEAALRARGDIYPEFDCSENIGFWSDRKRSWCCVLEQKGCVNSPGPFHCVSENATQNEDVNGWSEEKKAYCCVHAGLGCPGEPTTTTGFQPPTTTTAFKPLYDCQLHAGAWQSMWTWEQQGYCCKHENVGCTTPSTTTAFVSTEVTTTTEFLTTAAVPTTPMTTLEITTTTPTPTQWDPTLNPYDCKKDVGIWHQSWTTEKKAWCCKFEMVGCEASQTTTTPFPQAPGAIVVPPPPPGPPPTTWTTTTPFPVVPGHSPGDKYNCLAEAYSDWSSAKRDWCCIEKSCGMFGCVKFDCQAGLSNWRHGWSICKKKWCCNHFQRGCEEEEAVVPATTTLPRTTTTPYPKVPQLHHEKHHHDDKQPFNLNPFQMLPNWDALNGNPITRTTTTPYPDRRPKDFIDGGRTAHHHHDTDHHPTSAPSPRKSGWTTRVSSSCREAIQFIDSDQCDAEVLLASVQRTCPVKTKAGEDACEAWFGNIKGMSQAKRNQEIDRCTAAVRATAQVSQRMSQVQSASEDERKLCFKCEVKCYSRHPYHPASRRLDAPGDGRALRAAPHGGPGHCRPHHGGLQRRERREARSLSAAEWMRLESAMKRLKSNGKLDDYARLFMKGMPPEDPTFMNFQSLPWYRRFIFDFETDLQAAAQDCDLTLPYWSSCLEAGDYFDSKLFSSSRLGGQPECQDGGGSCRAPRVEGASRCSEDGKSWCLGNGIAGGWQVGSHADKCQCVHRSPGDPEPFGASCASLMPHLRLMEDFKSLSEGMDALRAELHCGAVPGRKSTLCRQETAVWDPLFWMDYAFMDRLFQGWQRYHAVQNDIKITDCFGCQMQLTHYGVPLYEWFGETDADDDCVKVPKSDPIACVAYAGA